MKIIANAAPPKVLRGPLAPPPDPWSSALRVFIYFVYITVGLYRRRSAIFPWALGGAIGPPIENSVVVF